MDYGLPPSESAFAVHAGIVAHYLNGGYYPVGGAASIAERIISIIESKGGKCLLNHSVTEIIVNEGKAIGVKVGARKGQQDVEAEFYASVIVSDAGAYATFCRLLPEGVPISFRSQLERLSAGYGCVSLYIGLKEDPAKIGFGGENHWIYAGYDHDTLFRKRNDLLEGQPVACLLSFPSLRDPEATAHTAEIIAPMDYASVEVWKERPWRKRGTDYQELKDRIAEGLISFVDQRYPGFKALVNFCEVATPLTVETLTGHFHGSIYGIPATPERFKQPWLKVTTPLNSLYLTGADVASHGIMGAMMGGVATAAYLQGSLGFFRIISAAKRFAAKPHQKGDD